MGKNIFFKRYLTAPVLVFFFATACDAAILMRPYLQAVTKDSIYVMAEADSKEPVTVQYGTSDSYGNSATTMFSLPTTQKNSFVHRIKITGLKTGVIYHYRASHNGGDWTKDSYFRTAPEKGRLFKFACASDFRTGTAVHDKISAAIMEFGPDLLLYGGDLCMDGSYKAFKDEFFRPAELALITRTPFFCAPGNHEGWGINSKAFLQAPDSASGSQSYYSFDYGDLHVLVVNNFDPGGYAGGSAQYKFAQKDLEASGQKWKAVLCHVSPYCGDAGHGEDPGMIEMAEKIFEPGGADVVISGHSHLYQHNKVGNIHYFVIGSAGAPLYEPTPMPYTLKTVKSYCFAACSADQCDLFINARNQDSETLDNLQLRKCQQVIHVSPPGSNEFPEFIGTPEAGQLLHPPLFEATVEESRSVSKPAE